MNTSEPMLDGTVSTRRATNEPKQARGTAPLPRNLEGELY